MTFFDEGDPKIDRRPPVNLQASDLPPMGPNPPARPVTAVEAGTVGACPHCGQLPGEHPANQCNGPERRTRSPLFAAKVIEATSHAIDNRWGTAANEEFPEHDGKAHGVLRAAMNAVDRTAMEDAILAAVNGFPDGDTKGFQREDAEAIVDALIGYPLPLTDALDGGRE
ncbi:MAG TPA: hypothetical protein VFZ00_28465 [Solirubrobacter sp.]|nr:hypothetical protein [Solirubrobacter sp.]